MIATREQLIYALRCAGAGTYKKCINEACPFWSKDYIDNAEFYALCDGVDERGHYSYICDVDALMLTAANTIERERKDDVLCDNAGGDGD